MSGRGDECAVGRLSGAEATALLTLQAVRLAGVANEEAILDRALVSERQVGEVLAQAAAEGLVEQMSFADFGGWVITERGSARLAGLLAREVEIATARPVLTATLDAFEVVNGPFVERVAQWQLRSTSSQESGPAGGQDAGFDALLADLSESGASLRTVLADLIGVLPRFGRYPAQYAAALDRARTDGLRWVTGVGLLSCHVVWAELHQDLLSSLGRGRGAQTTG